MRVISDGERTGDPLPVPRMVKRVPSNVPRLVAGNLLHFEALKANCNVVLSDVVRGALLGEAVAVRIASSPSENI